MYKIINQLSLQGLTDLAAMKGQTLKFVTGNHLAPSLFTDNFVVVTDRSELVISGSVSLVDFDGDVEEMSHIEVNAISQDLVERLIESDARYFYFNEEPITDVIVFREKITFFQHKSEVWEYVSDTGIVFCTQSGFIKVQRCDHLDVMLNVEFLRQKPDAILALSSRIFASDLIDEYVIESSEESVADLLREAKA